MPRPIPDHLRQGLNIIFIGYNPSLRSGETGHHYANRNNRFWEILYRSGLAPRKYNPQEDHLLLELGFGLTNIVSRPSQAAADITREEYVEGRRQLQEKIALYRPRVACFVGKGVYQEYSGKRNVQWGLQKEQFVPGVIDFVAPSSSGLVRIRIEEIVKIYSLLPEIIS